MDGIPGKPLFQAVLEVRTQKVEKIFKKNLKIWTFFPISIVFIFESNKSYTDNVVKRQGE